MCSAVWSVKGGAGSSVVAVALASMWSASSPFGSLLVDGDGDIPAMVGSSEPAGPGITEWLAADSDVPIAALDRIQLPLSENISLLPKGRRAFVDNQRNVEFVRYLQQQSASVVADLGVVDQHSTFALDVLSSASRSVLVLRSCFVSLRRALALNLSPTDIVLIEEPQRALCRGDVEDVLGQKLSAVIPFDPAIARCVDAGLLLAKLPEPLRKTVSHVVR